MKSVVQFTKALRMNTSYLNASTLTQASPAAFHGNFSFADETPAATEVFFWRLSRLCLRLLAPFVLPLLGVSFAVLARVPAIVVSKLLVMKNNSDIVVAAAGATELVRHSCSRTVESQSSFVFNRL